MALGLVSGFCLFASGRPDCVSVQHLISTKASSYRGKSTRLWKLCTKRSVKPNIHWITGCMNISGFRSADQTGKNAAATQASRHAPISLAQLKSKSKELLKMKWNQTWKEACKGSTYQSLGQNPRFVHLLSPNT